MKAIKTRRLISWISFCAFSVLGVSGLVLYFSPQGRIAYWADWRFLSFTKDDWGNIHVIMSMLFLVTAVWHIVLNWKSLVNYLKNQKKRVSWVKPEFVVAVAITLMFAGGAYFQVPPFGSTLNALANVKVYWENKHGAPPWGHAELSSLKSFTKKMNFDEQKSLAVLQAKGLTGVSPTASLKDLARANHTSPKAIMELLAAQAVKAEPAATQAAAVAQEPPTGLGRMSLEQMSATAGVDTQTAIQRLTAKVSVQASADMKVKAIAEAIGETPLDIWYRIKE